MPSALRNLWRDRPAANGRDGSDGEDGTPAAPGRHGKDGIDGLRGPPGPQGLPGRDGTDGKQGLPGKAGEDGDPGLPPEHQWNGTKLRFRRPDGDWGPWVDLEGRAAGAIFYGGGGGGGSVNFDSLFESLPAADGSTPDYLIVHQSDGWRRATIAQVIEWLGGAAAQKLNFSLPANSMYLALLMDD